MSATVIRPTAREAARPHLGAIPRRRVLRTAVLSLATVGVVAGGSWGMLAPRGAEHPSGALASVGIPDGTLRVDGLVDRQVGHIMPGMDVAKDVPVGLRRFAVDVTLGATEGRSLRYSRRDFTVSGPGVRPVVPVDSQFADGTLSPGQAIAGGLSFDVPKDATSLSIRFRQTEAVALPVLPPIDQAHPMGDAGSAPAATTQGHEDGHADHDH